MDFLSLHMACIFLVPFFASYFLTRFKVLKFIPAGITLAIGIFLFVPYMNGSILSDGFTYGFYGLLFMLSSIANIIYVLVKDYYSRVDVAKKNN